MTTLSRSTVLCNLLLLFLGGLYAYFIWAEGMRIIDYLFQNFSPDTEVPLWMNLDTKTGYFYTDSLTNIKTGEVYGIRYEKAETEFTSFDVQRIPLWMRTAGCLCGVALFYFVICSMKLLRNFLKYIRERQVFTYDNVRLLHRLGMSLAAVGVFSLLFACLDYWGVTLLIDFENYGLELDCIPSLLYFVAAAFSWLGAEIFYIGLKMREEQELTI